jgi:hypothetical protein
MCAKGWRMKRYNPAGSKIKVFEMPHEPDRFSPRGGPNTGMFTMFTLGVHPNPLSRARNLTKPPR